MLAYLPVVRILFVKCELRCGGVHWPPNVAPPVGRDGVGVGDDVDVVGVGCVWAIMLAFGLSGFVGVVLVWGAGTLGVVVVWRLPMAATSSNNVGVCGHTSASSGYFSQYSVWDILEMSC